MARLRPPKRVIASLWWRVQTCGKVHIGLALIACTGQEVQIFPSDQLFQKFSPISKDSGLCRFLGLGILVANW